MEKFLRLIDRKILVFMLVFILGSSHGQVTLPHYDGFDLTPTAVLQGQNSWAVLNTGDNILVASNSLNYSGLPNSTGNKITFDGAGMDSVKPFTTQSVNTGTTVYYSFLLNVSALGSLGSAGGYFTGLNDTTAGGFASTVWLKSDGVGGFNIGFNPRTTPANVIWTGSRALNTTYLVVLSLQSVAGITNDVSKIWINPVLGISEPAPTTSIINTGTDFTAGIAKVLLRQPATAAECPFVEMDELRVGLSYESVTGAIVWSGTAWSNGTGPTSATDASIEGVYDTAVNGIFSARNLILNNGSLTLKTGTNITVTGAVVNKLTADKFIVESNANLIQSNASTNIGNITVKRTTNIKRLDYTYWCSPVASQTLANLSPATLPNRFYGLNNANTFVATPSSTLMVAATGYSVRAPDNFSATAQSLFTASFVGKPNNGQQTVSFSSTGSEYLLLGNPYPSTISASSFLTANAGSLYFWTHSVYQGGIANYATFTTIGTAAATTPSLGGAPNGTIQVGQGFMYLPNAGDDIAVFENTMRVGNNMDQFFRTTNNQKNKYWLNLKDSKNGFSQILVGYVPSATTGFDISVDAKQINSSGIVLYSLVDSEKLAIQGRPDFVENDAVSLGFVADGAGNFSFEMDHTEGIFNSSQDIFLNDKMLGKISNISSNPYTFSSQQGTFNNRFELVYRNTLGTNTKTFDANSIVVFNANNSLNITSGITKMSIVQVFDLQGRMIFEQNNINSNAIIIDSINMKSQIGLVKITSISNEVIAKKVIF